jgi:hypothetical protein
MICIKFNQCNVLSALLYYIPNPDTILMKKILLSVLLVIIFFSCHNEKPAISASNETSDGVKKEALKFADFIGDTLRYDVGEPVFDIVITSDTTLYWKSLNPKYGTEAYEKIVVLHISDHENMISYIEEGNIGVCWYNDFDRQITTVSVFVGSVLMTFTGTVNRKHIK